MNKLNLYKSMRTVLLIIITLLFNYATQAQEGRGSSLLNNNTATSGNIHAVIVGVSAYGNLPDGKQLNFADDDAKEFYEYLVQQPNVKPENIILLLDQEAVLSNVDNAIRQQMRNANQGDTFIFFFAGHGDVQQSIESGFLLLHDVNLGNEYSWDDAYALNDLEKNAIAFTNRKKGKVILISDACHSGKLITDNEYAKAFSTGLVKEWENTIKMVSCAPSQVSFEDVYWGNGNGVFTYYLLEGLKGEADNIDIDKKINLRELEKFVSNRVYDDVKSKKGLAQDPEFEGDKEAVLFDVVPFNEQATNNVVASSNTLNSNGGRGLGNPLYDELSDYTKSLLVDFNNAIENKKLLSPKDVQENEKIKRLNNELLITGLSDIISFQVDNEANSIYAVEANRIFTKWDAKNMEEQTKSRLPVLANTYEVDEKNGMLIASTQEEIKIISTRNWVDVLSTLPISSSTQNNLRFKRIGERLIYNPEKNKIEIWDTNSWNKTAGFKAGKKVINALGTAEGLDRLFVTSNNNTIYAYNLNGEEIGKLTGHTASITDLKISPNQKQLISFSSNNEIIIWDTKSLQQLQKHQISSINKDIAAFNPQSEWFAIASENKLVLIDLVTENAPHLLNFNTNELSGLAFTDHASIHYSLKSSIGKFEFEQPSRYASAIYELLLRQSDIAPIKEDITGQLVAALQLEAQQIIKPFALGEEVVPSTSEVALAISQLDYALNIMDEEYANKQHTESKKLFLQGYEILLKHAVNRYDEAIGYFEKVVELEPNASFPHNALSLVYDKKNQLQKAKEKLGVAIATTPRWFEPKSNLGKTFMKEGKFAEARVEFEKIISLYPSLSKGFYNMSQWHFAKGDMVASEKSIEDALLVDPDNPALRTQAALIAKERGQFQKAASLLELAIEKANTYYKPYLELATLKTEEFLNYAGDETLLIQSLKLLEKARELSDYLPEVNQRLGSFYLTLYENYPENTLEGLPQRDECLPLAKQYLDNAALLAPYDTDIYEAKANYHLIKNDMRSGMNILETHLKETQSFPQGRIALAEYIFYTISDELAVENNFKTAININPNNLDGYVKFADFYHRLKLKNPRDSIMAKALEIFPTSPLLHYKQGIYWISEAENKNAGILSLRKALDIDAEYRPASMALFTLEANTEKTFIETGYESVQQLTSNSLLVKKDEHYYFTDIAGKVTSDTYYDKVFLKGKGQVVLEKDGLKGYQDLINDIEIPIEYEDIRFQKDGSLVVIAAQKEGWINATGEMIIAVNYESLTLMKTGLIRAEQDGVYGALSMEDGSEVVPFKYNKMTDGVWSNGNIPMMCCYFGENDSDAIDGNGKILGRCNAR